MRFRRGLEPLLHNTTAVRLLRTLSRFPGREFTGSELAVESGASVPSSIRELNRLLHHGVVSKRQAGNAQLWRWRETHYLTEPLADLFQAEAGALKALGSLIIESLSPLRDVVRIVIFGSVARGDERPESDVDLLVIVGNDRSKVAVEAKLDRLRGHVGSGFGNSVAAIVYTSDEARRKNRLPLLENIEREGLVLLDRQV